MSEEPVPGRGVAAALLILLATITAYAQEFNLQATEPRDRAEAISHIVQTRQVEALEELEKVAKSDPIPGIRRLACWAIGELHLEAGVPTLRTVVITDHSAGVRLSAKRALEKINLFHRPVPPPGGQTQHRSANLATPENESGGCFKDTDCKAKRVCSAGTCQDAAKRPTMGWALEASVIGYVGAAAVGGLTIYAALHPEDLLPSIPLAASATLVTIIAAPSVKTGSQSVRDPNGVPGSLTLRAIGWLSFGIHICGSLALAAAIPFHWINENEEGERWTPNKSWIVANGIVGMASLIVLASEALVARHQVLSKPPPQASQQKPARAAEKLSLAFFTAPTAIAGGISGGVAGLAGTF